MIDLQTSILGISIFLQVLAAMFALRCAVTAEFRLAWVSITLALALMAGWHSARHYDLVFQDASLVTDPWAEMAVLLFSLLMAVGLWLIGPLIAGARKTESEYRESADRYRSLVEIAPDAIIVHDGHMFVFANEAAAQMHGAASPADLIGREWINLIHPDERAGAVRRNAAFMAAGTPAPFIARRRLRIDGSEIMVESAAAPVAWNGRPAILGIFRDMSARIEAEHILRDSEERYRTLSELSPEAIIVSCGDHIVFANESAARLHAATAPESLIGREWLSLVHPDEIDDARRRNALFLLKGNSTEVFQRRQLRIDGTTVPVEMRVAGIAWSGEPGKISVYRDITERLQAEEAQRASEAQLRQVIDLVPHMIFARDRQGRYLLANKALAEFHNLAVDDLVGLTGMQTHQVRLEWDRFAEEDRHVFKTGEQIHISRQSLISSDGRKRITEVTKIPFTMANTAEPAILGVAVDITDQEAALVALRESEERNRTLVDLLPDALIVNDAEHILFANGAAAELYGAASPDELVDREWLSFVHSDERSRAKELAGQLLETNQTMQLQNRRRLRVDGSEVYVEATGAAISWRGRPAVLMVLRDITKRLRAEADLRASEARLRQIIDLAPVMIYARDSQGRYLLSNHMAADVHGLSADDLIGLTVHQTHHDVETRNLAMASDKKVLDSGERLHIPRQRMARHDGSELIIETIKVPFTTLSAAEPAVLGVSVDITEREQALEALTESEGRYRDLVAFSPDALLVQEDGWITFANPAAAVIYGAASTDDLVGLEIISLLHPDARELHFSRRDRLITTKQPLEVTQQRRLRLDQTEILVESRGIPITWQGKFAVLGISRDVTARKQAEIRAQLREQELRQVQRLSSMGQLSSALAHELNQPLAAIVGYVQAGRRLLRTDGDESPQIVIDLLEKASNQTDRAGEIIRRMRNYAEHRELIRTPEDINEVIAEACDPAFLGVSIDNVDLKLELSSQVKAMLIDRIQLQQVIVNLVRNAMEAMESSEIRKLKVTTTSDPDVIFISISDTGPGIEDHILNQMFEPFATTKSKGMGFGLSISRSIVEAHGGRIWAERNPGGITTFNIELPTDLIKEMEIDDACRAQSLRRG